MNIIEKKYRMVNVAENLEHIAAQVALVQKETRDGGDRERLESLQWYVKEAISKAKQIGCPQTRSQLIAALQASIDSRLETEKAHGANVSLFPNRQQS